METVSVETISETGNSNDCQNNPKLSEKQKKKSGKKKKKSRKQENESKSNDSHITSQNENADEAFSAEEKKVGEIEKSTCEGKDQLSENCLSILPAESCQRDSVSCEEPGATLHHTDPIFSTREDSLPDANSNDSGKKRTKRKGKKKKESSSCEEKMLDDAEKTTYEDQVHPPNNPLSNGKIQEEGSCKHTQDSCEKSGAAQLCVDLNLSTPEDSQPNATNMTCSKKRKRKKEKDRNTLKESGVDIHSSNSEVAAEYNTISETGGSNSVNIKEKAVDSVVINSCLKFKDDTVEQQEGTDVKVDETVAQTQSHKAKKRKKRKTNTMEVCDPLGNTLATSTKNGPVECLENNDVNGGRELTSNLASQGGKSATGEENDFQNLEKTKVKETDENMDVVEVKCNTISEAQGSKSTSVAEKSVASVVINSSKNDTAEQEESTDVKLDETVAQTQTPKAKKKKKRKIKTMEVCDPLGITLATSTKSEPVERVENNDVNVGQELMGHLAVQRENSATWEENGFQNLEKYKENETDENTELKEDVVQVKCNTISEAEGSKSTSVAEKSGASVVLNISKNDTAEQQKSTDVKLDETVAQSQTHKAKKKKKRKTNTVEVCDPLGNKKKRKTNTVEVCDPLGNTLATSTKSEPVVSMENNDVNGGRELMSNLASHGGNSATREENGFQNLEKTKEKETDENMEEDVLEVKHSTISEAEGSKSVSIEEKSFASVMINSSKNDAAEQEESTDVKLDETVAQTQPPKAKKKKKRKTKTMEVCDPLGNTLATSTKSEPVECVENNDMNVGRELMSHLANQRENSATQEESGFQNLKKCKEKETNENNEVKEDILGAGVCEVRSKKRKAKKKKTLSEDHKTADMEVCGPSGSVEGLLDHSNQEDMKDCDGNARQEFGGEDMTSKIEKSATREKSGVQKSGKRKEMTKDKNIESSQDALVEEGVSDVGCKRKKRKRNKNTNCESVATMDTESVQCLLYPSNGELLQNCDGNADGEIASNEDLASKIEDSASKGESVQDVENTKEMKKDKKEEGDQDALGAEDVSKVELKTKKSKKKKKSLDHKADSMEKDDHKADSMEKDDHKADSMEKDDHKTDSMEKDDVSLPRCSCEGQRTRKLVVFDLNGILADIVQGHTGELVPDGKVSYRSVFRRPFVASFLGFCFERFDVAIWSSRRIGLDYMVNIIMRNYARNLLFCFDQNKCSATKFKTQENNNKPLFLKDLRRVWDRFGTCFSCGKRKYDETNTLLVDDSPDKALCNPPHTGIFPLPYQYTDRQDSALGPEGELRKYLERLADAKNVQKFVAENPFGQTAITETHESWEFYSKVVEAHK